MPFVPERHSFDYAVVRVVPRVERGEFLNAGVILFSSTAAYLAARVGLDRARLQALAPDADVDLVETYLEQIPKICAGGGEAGSIGQLPQRARFHWLVAPRSTILRAGPVHMGLTADPAAELDRLTRLLVHR
jgi:hypothetical protein